MTVYKISMPPNLYQKLDLKKSQYSKREEAIKAVETALIKNDIEYSLNYLEKKVSFLNKSNGEIASIIE